MKAHPPRPLEEHRATIEEEEKALQKGKGGFIFVLGLVVVALLGGLVFMMMGDDNTPYETLGKNVNRLKAEHFDVFWACTFQGPEKPKSNKALVQALNTRARNGGRRFGKHLTQKCLPHLGKLDAGLSTLILPDDARPQIAQLTDSTRELRGAISDYAGVLDGLEGPYHPDQSASQTSRIAAAWFGYRSAHTKLNSYIKTKLSK